MTIPETQIDSHCYLPPPANKRQRVASDTTLNFAQNAPAHSQKRISAESGIGEFISSQLDSQNNVSLAMNTNNVCSAEQNECEPQPIPSFHENKEDVPIIDLTNSEERDDIEFGFKCKDCFQFHKHKGDLLRHLRNYEERHGSDCDLERFIEYLPSKVYHESGRRKNKKKELEQCEIDSSDSSIEILNDCHSDSGSEDAPTGNFDDATMWRNIQVDPMQIAFTIKGNRSWAKVIKVTNYNECRLKVKIKYEIDLNSDKNKAVSRMIAIQNEEICRKIKPTKERKIRLKVKTDFIKAQGDNMKNIQAELWIDFIAMNKEGQTKESRRPIKITFV